MKSVLSIGNVRAIRRIRTVTMLFALATVLNFSLSVQNVAAQTILLSGEVMSPSGEALAGIPVRANRDNITVTVYTNNRGEYFYPAWSELKPDPSTVSVELPDYEHVKQTATLLAGETVTIDFTLTARTPSVEDATASEIVAALPGTDEQKHLLIQCDNCHSLQHAFRVPRDKEGWIQIVRRMAGERAMNRDLPNSRSSRQKQYLEPLAEYLTMIRGPGSSDNIPFKLRPRPTSEASTRLVVTEYSIPRQGSKANIIRGDRRAAWPHDVLVEPDGPYAYYTDHFSDNFGRLDRRTGEVVEFPYEVLEGMGRPGLTQTQQAGSQRAGNPAGGAHDMLFDSEGNVVFGMAGGTMVFNTKTEEFTPYVGGWATFGIDAEDNVWYHRPTFQMLDLKTGELSEVNIPNAEAVGNATYDMETDPQGRSFLNMISESSIGMYDPATGKFETFPTPTHGSGPRRGDMDDQGRAWMGLYYAGSIGMFDPNTKQVKEFRLLPDLKPDGPPFVSPYSVAVDDKHQIVWTNDFNSRRTYKVDIRTGESTEYYMPQPYEVRDITVEDNAPRPTVWIPSYRPPSGLVRIELF